MFSFFFSCKHYINTSGNRDVLSFFTRTLSLYKKVLIVTEKISNFISRNWKVPLYSLRLFYSILILLRQNRAIPTL